MTLTVFTGTKDQCPKPCSSYQECKTCLEHTKCGWCSVESKLTGLGVCTEGTMAGPSFIGSCDAANFSSIALEDLNTIHDDRPQTKRRPDIFLTRQLSTSWHFQSCPPENECSNGHHNCDPQTQICIDELDGYKCVCNDGYEEVNGKCRPVCSQGCHHGDCVEPEVCKCHFSFVGDSCEFPCQCNGHSDCSSAEERDKCLDCRNNTMGDQCQFCK